MGLILRRNKGTRLTKDELDDNFVYLDNKLGTEGPQGPQGPQGPAGPGADQSLNTTDDVTFNKITTSNLTFSDTGPVYIESGNDLKLTAAGEITFNGNVLSTVAFSNDYNDLTNKPDIISKTELKAIAAASTDFADFVSRIANL